jgi:hypothetical protein
MPHGLVHTRFIAFDASWLQALGYDPATVEGLEAARHQHLTALRASKEALEQLEAQLGGLDFNYKAPEKGWDHNRVKGVSHGSRQQAAVCFGGVGNVAAVVASRMGSAETTVALKV